MTVLGVVLAAGGGTRYRGPGPKQLIEVDGTALVDHAIRAATGAGLDGVLLVDGAFDLSGRGSDEVRVLHNPGWREGIATSLLMAISHARSSGFDAVVVGLADQPGVPSEAWRAVAAAPSAPPLAVATYDGRRGNPVRIAAAAWDLLPVTGDEGARALMRARPELVREVPCTGEPADIDTVEDLQRWS